MKNLQDVLDRQTDVSVFPYDAINKSLNIEAGFSETEIENLLATQYGSKYSYLILSLLYPGRDWKDNTYHEDHIFPKSEFTTRSLNARKYDADDIASYQKHFNTVANLQLLTDKENLEKNAAAFDGWLQTRDAQFRTRHTIPVLPDYGFDHFLKFIEKRRADVRKKLKSISM